MLKVWPTDAQTLREEQRRLAALSPPLWRFAPDERVGACFVCFAEDPLALSAGSEPAWAAAVTFLRGRRTAAAVVAGSTAARFGAGLLALRAGPLLERAVLNLPQAPDVVIVNATGRDHPRRCGLALHLGAVLGLPTVGVTDRPLVVAAGDEAAAGDEVAAAAAGEAAALRQGGREVAYLVRPGPVGRGVWAHAAWRTDAATAASLVRAVSGPGRTPAPLREARRLARTARAAALGSAPYPPSDPTPSEVA
jgi:deoxyribonuclease V